MVKFLFVSTFFVVIGVAAMDLMYSGSGQTKFVEVILDRVEEIFNNPEISEWNIRVRKVNKTRALVGVITLFEPVGNNFSSEYKMLRKQGGEYRYLPYSVPESPVCDFLSKDQYFYPYFANYSDFPKDIAANCPLAPGNYSLYGISYEMGEAFKVILQTGEYAVEMFFYKNNVLAMNSRIYAFVNAV